MAWVLLVEIIYVKLMETVEISFTFKYLNMYSHSRPGLSCPPNQLGRKIEQINGGPVHQKNVILDAIVWLELAGG